MTDLSECNPNPMVSSRTFSNLQNSPSQHYLKNLIKKLGWRGTTCPYEVWIFFEFLVMDCISKSRPWRWSDYTHEIIISKDFLTKINLSCFKSMCLGLLLSPMSDEEDTRKHFGGARNFTWTESYRHRIQLYE